MSAAHWLEAGFFSLHCTEFVHPQKLKIFSLTRLLDALKFASSQEVLEEAGLALQGCFGSFSEAKQAAEAAPVRLDSEITWDSFFIRLFFLK